MISIPKEYRLSNGRLESIIDSLFDEMLINLPSVKDPQLSILMGSVIRLRRKYISKFGFVVLTKEFQEEIILKLRELGINTFIDLGAGTGSFTKMLINEGLEGLALTLDIPEDSQDTGMRRTPIFKDGLDKGYIRIANLENCVIDNMCNLYDMVVCTWVPLEGGIDHITFLKNNGLPEWHLSINEEGGCTGNGDYWNFINDNYDEVYEFKSYKTFAGLWDRAILYKKKIRR